MPSRYARARFLTVASSYTYSGVPYSTARSTRSQPASVRCPPGVTPAVSGSKPDSITVADATSGCRARRDKRPILGQLVAVHAVGRLIVAQDSHTAFAAN